MKEWLLTGGILAAIVGGVFAIIAVLIDNHKKKERQVKSSQPISPMVEQSEPQKQPLEAIRISPGVAMGSAYQGNFEYLTQLLKEKYAFFAHLSSSTSPTAPTYDVVTGAQIAPSNIVLSDDNKDPFIVIKNIQSFASVLYLNPYVHNRKNNTYCIYDEKATEIGKCFRFYPHVSGGRNDIFHIEPCTIVEKEKKKGAEEIRFEAIQLSRGFPVTPNPFAAPRRFTVKNPGSIRLRPL